MIGHDDTSYDSPSVCNFAVVMMETCYSPFDVVILTRSDRAIRLYNHHTEPLNRTGWAVVQSGVDWLLLYRDGLLIRIPHVDVRLVAKYDINALNEHLRSVAGYGQQPETQTHLGNENGDAIFDASP